jgi:hypothetical protein
MSILHAKRPRKAHRVGHILCSNCHIKHAVEGNIEGTNRGEGTSKQLVDDVKENGRHWNLE